MHVYGKYFYGNKISDYGLEHGYVDYATLAKAFDAVMNNYIFEKGWEIGNGWEQVSGYVDYSDEIEELIDEIDELTEQQEEKEEEAEEIREQIDEEENKENRGKLWKALNENEKALAELKKQIEEKEAERDELEEKQERSENAEIFQWFIVDDRGARILEEVGEIVYYNEELDINLWGVTHWGTSWNYVLTDIRCNTEEEA